MLSHRRNATLGLLVAFLILALLEGGLRLAQWPPEGPEGDAPPALVEAVRALGWEPNPADRRLLREDPHTLWSLVAELDLEIPSYVQGGEPWRVRIGPHGYRGAPPDAAAGVPRVVCAGNSCTFGLLVSEGETWPERLAETLERSGVGPVEVLNYAVPGFTSEQGRWLVSERVLPLRPDLVVLSFGFNDTWPAPESDRSRIARQQSAAGRLRRSIGGASIIRALDRTLRPLREGRRAAAAAPREVGERVSAARRADNLRHMILSLRDAGIPVLLLALDFPRGDSVAGVAAVAAELALPFVDARAAFAEDWRAEPLPQLIELLASNPAAPAIATLPVTLMVAAPSHLPRPITLVGTAPALGGGVPGTVSLPDDGRGPDQHAGDGIHTITLRLPGDRPSRYLFQSGAEPGSWNGLESPLACRRWSPCDANEQRMRFGRLPLMAEAIHPSASGCEAIALLVARAIEQHRLLPPDARR